MEKIKKLKRKMIAIFIVEYLFVAIIILLQFADNINDLWGFVAYILICVFGILGIISWNKYVNLKRLQNEKSV